MPRDFSQDGRLQSCLTSATTAPGTHPSATRRPSHSSMLTSAAPPLHPPTTDPRAFSTSRPTLPPLSHVQPLNAPLNAPLTPALTPSGVLPLHGESAFHSSPPPYRPYGPPNTLLRLSTDSVGHGPIPVPSGLSSNVHPPPILGPHHSPSSALRLHNPLKRGLEQTDVVLDRPAHFETLAYSPQIDRNDHRLSGSPTSTVGYPTFGQPIFSSRQQGTLSNPITSRCLLHIRQQPRAARAGPDGKDRRPIDPPPVVQLLMKDFDPDNPADVEELQNSYYVVHCRLVSANSPRRDVSTLASTTEDGSKEVQRLLLGSAVSSPHHTKDDPNPSTMPCHPVSETPSGPPSPTMRFITLPSTRPRERPASEMPGTFFIFADLSVRKAGEYRLEFNLMKVEADKLVPGASMPIIHTVASQAFKVVNAKDFDQVQPSTKLVRGLIERGAGFPLKLKKGTREGQRRRQYQDQKIDPGSHEGTDDDDDCGGED